ncbi:aldehyde dehydrogenase [Thozetella sp. PMI_491]|nr:aldehyde dehydrogenase [Thozetella sp. PMI_491]
MAQISAQTNVLSFSEFYNIIDGELSVTEKTRYSVNPSTEELNPEVPLSTRQDVDRAVAAAKKAFEGWSKTARTVRAKAIASFADALEAHADAFGVMITKEQGRPMILAKAEVQTGATWLREIAKIEFEEEILEDTPARRVVVSYKPLGVAAGIIPWNFPVIIACAKLSMALLSGNTFIMKPSPFTPYCGLKLCELAQSFFPPGVFQCLSGNDDLGPWLTEHSGIDKISFTGSSETGKRVMGSCSKTLKRVTLELGGNDPAIVCSDVDVDGVALAMAQLAWFNSSQVCVAVKRIYVHESIYSQFLQTFAAATSSIPVGDGFKDGIVLGPVANKLQYHRVAKFIEEIKAEGFNIVTGGQYLQEDGVPANGFFIRPTVVDCPPDSSRVVSEEPFGPVLPLMKWTEENEVIRRANDTRYGLGASVWTRNSATATRIARQLDAGIVWVNNHMQLEPGIPYGGLKDSGFGVELGAAGVRSYCSSQSLVMPKMETVKAAEGLL